MKLLNTLGTALVLIILIPLSVSQTVAGPLDLDRDGFINGEDYDIDGDGIPNYVETEYGLNPYSVLDGGRDMDADGWTNEEEYRFVSAMDDPNDNPDTQQSYPMQRVIPAMDYYEFWGTNYGFDGTTLAIGDLGADVDRQWEDKDGNVQLYQLENGLWQPGQILIPHSSHASGYFGMSLDLLGDTLAVGTPRWQWGTETLSPGEVYVYGRNDGVWEEEARIIPEGTEKTDVFGRIVALSGDQLLVACRYCENHAGYVFVYERDGGNWTQSQVISNYTSDYPYSFAEYMAVDGDQALMTASHYTDGYKDAMITYVYKRTDGIWELEAEIPFHTPDAADFSLDFDVSGETIFIRETAYDENDVLSSATYEYVKKEGIWMQQSVLYPGDFGVEVLGERIALAGDRALMSASLDGSSPELVIELTRTDGVWTETSRMYDPIDPTTNFGYGLKIDPTGQRAVMGQLNSQSSDGEAHAYIVDYQSE